MRHAPVLRASALCLLVFGSNACELGVAECPDSHIELVLPARTIRVVPDNDGRIRDVLAHLRVDKTPEEVDCHRIAMRIDVEPEDPTFGTLSHAILQLDPYGGANPSDWVATTSPTEFFLQADVFDDCYNVDHSVLYNELVQHRVELVTDYAGPMIVRVEPTIEVCSHHADVEPDYIFTVRQ